VASALPQAVLARAGAALERGRGADAAQILVPVLRSSTLSRDEGWSFLVLGRNLERIDMTARLLSDPP
jgi:hypothetical protein